MRKILPFLPISILILGGFLVLNSRIDPTRLKADLAGKEGTETIEICTKPEIYSEENERAWCQVGSAIDIVKNKSQWTWICSVENEKHSCLYSETKNLRTRRKVWFGD